MFKLTSSTKRLALNWTNQHNWDLYHHSNLLPINWADLLWKNTLCRGTVIPTNPPDGFQASREGGTEGGQGINRHRDRSHLFSVSDNLVTHIETHCRSEIISHFTLILSNLSQHDPEKHRCVRWDPLWISVTMGCSEVADIQYSPSGSNWTLSWNQP